MPQFDIDALRSRVWVSARSSLHPIKASTTEVRGWIEAEVPRSDVGVAALTRARLEVDVEHLKTGSAFYDQELRRRADADRFPSIVGELTAISALPDDAQFRVVGDLSFHGVTRSAVDEIEVRMVDDRTIALAGTSTFDLRDFGLDPPRLLGLKVHPEITVRVRLVAVTGV